MQNHDVPAEPLDALAAALRALHVGAGKPSMRALAHDVSLSHTTVADALNGKRVPSWGTIETLVRRLGGNEKEFRRLWLAVTGDTASTKREAEAIPAMSANPVGFWCYSRRDDELDGGRIRRLSEYIADEFEIITGERLEIFLDDSSISWGDAWRTRIESALASATFLIPVITPRFLKSQECRKEVITFSGHAASLGLDNLLLPIHYVNVPQITDDHSNDEVVTLLSRRQFLDWRDLRLEDEGSPRYRRAVHQLALHISEILETASPSLLPGITEEVGLEDDPGFIDLMAEAESALPEWLKAIEALAKVTQDISEIMVWATSEIEASDVKGGGFTGRVRIIRSLAERLKEPADSASSLGIAYSNALLRVDPGIIRIIRNVSEGVFDAEEEETARELFDQLKEFITITRTATPELKFFAESARSAGAGSRDIRPLMNDIYAAYQNVVDGQAIIDEWGRLIDEHERSRHKNS
ncbi:toll/interleukin-1 receptor domain-containing protein [Streptomyces europaeiscabiei]|uniref:toll/interleukin-1 receptor domain-containing protein n=1 Tax=Streptomyces europaeiscabiei TaxID=146819 RepID=UPI0029AC7688|nr:toll/interleukin-1 receptor domain-containing protein [Streptomyces europaeiscabiei]MDX3782501.1 toll/interleukin-1 receptor domain-containing protein [Streptomyces europaeiscabiei]